MKSVCILSRLGRCAAAVLTVAMIAFAAENVAHGGTAEVAPLERQLKKEPANVSLAFHLSYLYEENAILHRARDVLQQALRFEDSYDIQLRLGYLNSLLGDFDSSVTCYKKAASSIPESEDAWLGLQWSHLQAGRYEESIRAGSRLLMLNDKHAIALARQALANFMLGDFPGALSLYQNALSLDPENGEFLLGMGFTLLRLDKTGEGKKYCERAKSELRDDPRIQECLATQAAKKIIVSESVWSTFLHYTDPWNQRNLISFSLSSDLLFPAGFGFWIGGAFSRTVLRYQAENFWQAAPILGIYYLQRGFSIAGSAVWLFSNSEEVGSTRVGIIEGGYDGQVVGGGIRVSGSFYPRGNAFQIDPRMRFHIQNRAVISAGPELTIVDIKATPPPQGSRSPNRVQYLWSGHLHLQWMTGRLFTLYLGGYGGWRQYAVDAAGLSVWSSDDLFIGGYELGFNTKLGKYFGITALFRHDIGKKQYGMDHDFSVLGGSVGLHARF